MRCKPYRGGLSKQQRRQRRALDERRRKGRALMRTLAVSMGVAVDYHTLIVGITAPREGVTPADRALWAVNACLSLAQRTSARLTGDEPPPMPPLPGTAPPLRPGEIILPLRRGLDV